MHFSWHLRQKNAANTVKNTMKNAANAANVAKNAANAANVVKNTANAAKFYSGSMAARCPRGLTPAAAFAFARTAFGRAQRVGGEGGVAAAIRLGRALAALQCVGSMQASLNQTVAYANTREQFGQTIGRFQAVRHHCANMASKVASARLLALEALSALDRGEEADVRVAAAKAAA